MIQDDIRQICYEKFGSYSKLALKILYEAHNFSNVHQLCFNTGVSYKFVKDVLYEFAICNGDDYIINESYDFAKIYNTITFSQIQQYENEIENLISQFKHHNKSLDHVSATANTLLKRVEFIFNNIDIKYSKILFLGDHDFTSIVLAYVLNKLNLDYSICVVDIDDNVLNFICDTAQKYNLKLTVLHSDFRFGIPTNFLGVFDLIFSDPPYTPEGMSLFLQRAIECSKNKFSSIYLCYKTAELSPAIGLKVQKELLKSHIYFRAILPNFNVYTAAEALGYRSDLYVCSLTSKCFDNKNCINSYDIYTHGNNSIEAKRPVKIDYQEIINLLSNMLKTKSSLIKIVSDKKFNSDNSILIDVFYKQKRNKNTNYPKESIFVFDFTYQNVDVIDLRNFIMSDKKLQFGIFLNNQTKVLKNDKYKAILSLYNVNEIYKNDIYSINSFELKNEVLLSNKKVMLYKNSNLKNAYVSCVTQNNAITKNQAREEFNKLPIKHYGEAMVFDLPLFELERLYESLK